MSYADLFERPYGPYFLSHSVGLLPKASREALAVDYLNPWSAAGGGAWEKWLEVVAAFRAEVAALLGVDASEICPQANLSSAFAKYLGALPGDAERRTVVMSRDAFPTMGFVVNALERRGFALRLIDTREDEGAKWAAALDETVAVALITHVHSNTGHVADVAAIAAAARKQGARAAVDIAQSVGVRPIDLRAWKVDAAFGSCVKYCCGGPGAGYLYVAREDLPALRPDDAGWFSHENPFEYDIEKFSFAADASRFWGGTPSVAPFAVARASIRQLAAIGLRTIAGRNDALRAIALEGVVEAGDFAAMGPTICLALPRARADVLAAALTAAGAHFDRRADTLRLSLHIYNSEEDAALLNRLIRKVEG